MAEDFKPPADDGVPRLHGYIVPGSDTPVMLGCVGQYMSRSTALATLKQTFRTIPPELARVSHVELVALDDDDKPVRLGPVQIAVTPGSLGREIAAMIGGSRTTIGVKL